MGEPAGVAELAGIPAGDSGAGASATGDGAGGEETFLAAGLGAWETEDGGWVAGGREREDPDGETAGDCEGGDKVGDFAGDAWWGVGESAGGVAEEGGLAGAGECVDLGEGAGALSAWTKHNDVKNNANTTCEGNLITMMFGDFDDNSEWYEEVGKFATKNTNAERCLYCENLRKWKRGTVFDDEEDVSGEYIEDGGVGAWWDQDVTVGRRLKGFSQ